MNHRSAGRKFLLRSLLALCILFSQRAEAGKIYITKGSDNGRYMNGGNTQYAPGDTFVLRTSLGPLTYLVLENFHGTPAKPLVLINEGGQVALSDIIKLTDCTNWKITGSGSADQYGFKIEAYPAYGVAIEITKRSANVEVERILINSKKYGFWVKNDGSCDPALQYPNWTIANISLHDLRITNMTQEAFYLGSTDPNGDRPVDCNGVTTYPKPTRLANIRVYNNYIDHTFRGGIQLSAAEGSNEIFNNTITNVGYEWDIAQGNGIVLGGYTSAYIHDNRISNTYSSGIFALGTGLVRIENNRVENSGMLDGRSAPGMASIMIDTRPTHPKTTTTFQVRNNQLGSHTDRHIRIYNAQDSYTGGNLVCGNSAVSGALAVWVAAGIDWSNCSASNTPPTAMAGPDQTITLPVTSAQLDGSGQDADGLITTYAWSKVSGPSEVSFTNAASGQTTAHGLTAGTYVLRLTVSDNSGARVTDDLTLTVRNVPTSYTALPARIEAESFDLMNGIAVENTTDAGGGQSIGFIDYGDWMDYTISAPSAGTYTFNLRIATPNSGCKVELRKQDGTLLKAITLPQTNSWSGWQTASTSVSLPAGNQVVRIISLGNAFNFNWIEFNGGSAPAPQAPAATLPQRLEAEAYQNMSGVQKENTMDAGGGQNVGYIDNGDWMDYNVNIPAAATLALSVRVATPQNGGQLQVINGSGTVLATLSLPNTGGWQTWQTATGTITLPAGTQTLRIAASAAPSWNINWIELSQQNSTALPAPPPSGPDRIEAEAYTAMSGVQKENTGDAGGGQNLGYIDVNDWMDYSITPATAGTYTLSLRVASGNGGGQAQLRNSAGTVLGTVSIPNTGGWQSWQTVSTTVSLPAGAQTLRIQDASGNWNLNWLEVTPGGTATPPVTGNGPLRVEAEAYTGMSGIQKESTSDAGGGQNIGYVDPADWMDYSVNLPAGGTYTLQLRAASGNGGGQAQLRSASGGVLATLTIPNTGGWQSWQTVTATVTLPAGTQTLRLHAASGNWNVNWFELSSSAAPSAPARIEAEAYTAMSGVQKENTGDAGGGLNLGYIDVNDWMDYSITPATAGTYTLSLRVASGNGGGQAQLRNSAGTVLGTVSIPNTGGWQSWQTVSTTVSLPAGAQTLRIQDASGNWNLNWLEFVVAGQTSANNLQASETAEQPVTTGLQLFPNPATDRFAVRLNNTLTGKVQVTILDATGTARQRVVLQKSSSGGLVSYLSIGTLPAGSYLVQVSMDGWSGTARLIKQ